MLQVALVFHYVYKKPNGKYVCDCKAYWTSIECAHQKAAMHLEAEINLCSEMQGIERARSSGRPRGYTPLGYAAHQPFLTAQGEIRAASYIGAGVARYLRGDRQRIYCGKIVGNKLYEPEVVNV